MRAHAVWLACCIALASSAAAGDEPRPSAEDQARFVDAARQVALEYTSSLPNFLCTQTIKRFGLINRQRPRDVLTVEVGLENGRERYKLTEVNGSPTVGSPQDRWGLSSTGEFGNNLLRVFATKAKIRFERWTTLRGRAAAVYSYAVSGSEARYQLSYWDSASRKMRTTAAGLHGEIVIDRETYGVLRVEYIADSTGFLMRSTSTVDYDLFQIKDRMYLLPAKAVVAARGDINEIEYHSYRKFTTESQLTFGNEPSGP